MEKSIKLIDGDFNESEAREIIGSLLEFKIQFHGKQSFSGEIRNGSSDGKSVRRMQELSLAKSEFFEYLKSPDAPSSFTIRCDIKLFPK